jgi:hypothetical protein
MQREQFERMLESAGLILIGTMYHNCHFMVCLPLQAQFGTRYANGTLSFKPNDFADMDADEAQKHIEKCKKDIIKDAASLGGLMQPDGSVKRIKKRKAS